MRQAPTILDAHGREAQLPPSRQLAPRMPAVAPVGRAPPPASAGPAFASGWRRALQVVDAMLGVICAVAVIALLAFGFVWLLGLLFGRRGDR
jgi:hypothetical protein